MKKGVVSTGLVLPIITEGDSVSDILVNFLVDNNSELNLQNRDVLCVTESIVARSEGNYVSMDDVAREVVRLFGENPEVAVVYPIFSRNRFSMILKGIARACRRIYLVLGDERDEVGNAKINPFTGIDIEQFYKSVIEEENCESVFSSSLADAAKNCDNFLISECHPRLSREQEITALDGDREKRKVYGLRDLCSLPTSNGVGYNEEWGLLGSNKATDDKLKLFPRGATCEKLVNEVQRRIMDALGVKIEVMIYGDGAFKDPVGGIWEFADPIIAPGYTQGLQGTPAEVKFKYLVDNEVGSDEEKMKKIIREKERDLVGKMVSEGTTPRRYVDLLGSLADLTSGSGDRGTPVVLIQGYFKNFSD